MFSAPWNLEIAWEYFAGDFTIAGEGSVLGADDISLSCYTCYDMSWSHIKDRPHLVALHHKHGMTDK